MAAPIVTRQRLGVFALVMMNVVAVVNLRNLPITATYGTSLVSIFLIAGLLFLIPLAFICKQFTQLCSKPGGIYTWTSEAFGLKTGVMVLWLQWFYNVAYYPGALTTLMVTIAYLIDPHLAHDKLFICIGSLTLFWFSILWCCLGLQRLSWLSTAGTLLGTLIPFTLICTLGLLWYGQHKPVAISLTPQALLPNWHDRNTYSYLVTILFSLMGIELSAVYAHSIDQPKRTLPKALAWSVVLILGIMILGSLSVAMIVPRNELSIVTGLLDAYQKFFQAFHLTAWAPWFIGLILFGNFASMSAWVLGPIQGLFFAANDGALPSFLNRTNRFEAPTRLLILQAVIVSILCFSFFLFPDMSNAYWLFSAMPAVMSLLMYVIVFASAWKLRQKQRKARIITETSLQTWIANTITGIGLLTCLGTIIFGFVAPVDIPRDERRQFIELLSFGVIVFTLLPWIIATYTTKGRSHVD